MARGGSNSWAFEPVITCEGGPYAGQWFLEADWEHRRRATARIAELVPGKASPALDYQRTTRRAEHPYVDAVRGDVWEHPDTRKAPGSLPRAPRR